MASRATRERYGRLVTCEGCGHVFPQAEVRRFAEIDGAKSSLCLSCACRGNEAGRLTTSPRSYARLLDLVTAALSTPTWGETLASRGQRQRLRQPASVARVMRVLSAGGGE
ncbi:MAG: hypothetical protein GC161_18260 [Planctomycetaceae bacterium]|nr:hypothetical protein [Planctomycetaceae bacterium]